MAAVTICCDFGAQNDPRGVRPRLEGKPRTPLSSRVATRVSGETVETVSDFSFLGSKITADGDCNHKIKRCLLLRRKAMTYLDSILKSRDITLPTKVHLETGNRTAIQPSNPTARHTCRGNQS